VRPTTRRRRAEYDGLNAEERALLPKDLVRMSRFSRPVREPYVEDTSYRDLLAPSTRETLGESPK